MPAIIALLTKVKGTFSIIYLNNSFETLQSPNIISPAILKTFHLHKFASLSFHSRNIPRIFSPLIFLINASFWVLQHSRSWAPWIRLLYHPANAYALSNLHLCLLYSGNHCSILPFVCGLFRFDGMWLTPRAFRYCSNRLTPSSSSLRHLHRTECLDPYLLRLYNPDTLLLAFLHA